MQKNNNNGRREFLKNSSLFSLSILIAPSEIAFTQGAKRYPLKPSDSPSLTIELLRDVDSLFLQFEFFNARVKGNYIVPKEDSELFFCYVKLPSQHIAEELILNEDDLKLRQSFQSGPSFLAFEIKGGKLPLKEEALLDWENNFKIITLDDFLHANDHKTSILDDLKRYDIIKNRTYFVKNKFLPLSRFEIPFKMHLSPIAEAANNSEGDLRQTGYHIFHENEVLQLFHRRMGRYKINIYKPWENELHFKAFDGTLTPPRFKVVDAEFQDCDPDNPSNLLPEPIHRQELHNLTMLPEPERDVMSDFFKISSLGGSTTLKYKNEYPVHGTSIVAWDQEIKFARDNNVSVTFRAIDVFTGIKMLISLVAERKFKSGSSFLLKRYFIQNLEKEKSYEDPVVIGKMTFKKITPDYKGKYFEPVQSGTKNWYHVQQEGSKSFDQQKDLTFDYTGIDKEGVSHSFQSKIIFIPAESYTIKTGEYEYEIDGQRSKKFGPDKPVDFKYTGQLNPRFRVGFEPGEEKSIEECKKNEYTYEVTRIFNDQKLLGEILEEIGNIIYSNDLDHYRIKLNAKFTYANLQELKTVKGIKDNEQNLRTEPEIRIQPASENSTFPTRDILLFAQINKHLYSIPPADDEDFFNSAFPLIPFLHHASLIISQIDQIEGLSKYRTVALADSFSQWESEKLSDFSNDDNPARLLFKLIPPQENSGYIIPSNIEVTNLSNFFSNNYRRAGGMVNPGIVISHISVLDQGIIFNEGHNERLKKQLARKKLNNAAGVEVEGPDFGLHIPSSSIFKGLEAKICGIGILDIIDADLPFEEMPQFTFLQDARENFQQVETLVHELEDEYRAWKNEFEEQKKQVETWRREYEDIEKQIRNFKPDAVKQSLVYAIQQLVQAQNLCEQRDFLEGNNKSLVAYVNQMNRSFREFRPIFDQALLNSVFNEVFEQISNFKKEEPLQADIFFKLIESSKGSDLQIKEIIKIFLLEKIIIQRVEMKFYDEFYTSYNSLQPRIKKEYLLRYHAIREGIQEASQFSQSYLQKRIKEKRKFAFEKIGLVQEELKLIFGNENFLEELHGWILPIENLLSLYKHYRSLYSHFKFDYYENILNPPISEFSVTAANIEEELRRNMKNSLNRINISEHYPNLEKVRNYKRYVDEEILSKVDFLSHPKKYLEAFIRVWGNVELGYVYTLNADYERLRKEYETTSRQILEAEKFIANFGKNFQILLKRELKKIEEEVINEDNLAKYLEIKKVLDKLNEISSQQLNYSFNTSKFKEASLGVIEFSPRNTTLNVKVNYTMEMGLGDDLKPVLIKQSHLTKSTFTDFEISFLKLITIDFESVSFISGSDVKNDFAVKIRDVGFEGVLGFVQAFQEKLQNLNKNLIFEITAAGATVGYSFPIPDIRGGAFNFFNLNLSAALLLPFDPKKSLQFRFGLGSPSNKFGLTYSVFGGQGYFHIICEPQRGVVELEVVLEFGAIYYLNIGVANATVNCVGGIYIRKYSSNFEIRGYILCVGRFNVLNLFSASITFYLGLHGDGSSLQGECKVRVTKRFSRFFKVSVTCHLKKTISGTSKGNKEEANKMLFSKHGLYLIEENLLKEHIDTSQEFERRLKFVAFDDKDPQIILMKDGNEVLMENLSLKVFSENSGCPGRIYSIEVSDKNQLSGAYDIVLKLADNSMELLSRTIFRNGDNEPECKTLDQLNDESYYASYFHD